MDRRTFLAGTGAVLLAAPLAAEAQPAGKVYKIGFLTIQSSSPSSLDALYQGLREYGWTEGKTFVVTPKFAQYKSERLPELVAELVQLKVDVMVVSTAEAALAAKHGADLKKPAGGRHAKRYNALNGGYGGCHLDALQRLQEGHRGAGDITARVVKEGHDVQCDSQSPGDG